MIAKVKLRKHLIYNCLYKKRLKYGNLKTASKFF